jgi:hypothetical protein
MAKPSSKAPGAAEGAARSPAKGKGKALKVFRTPIGFHDAFVAAPSQKAALEAWGSESNLFAQGVAEIVTDPALMEEPLARPGEVVRRLRGSADEQIEALGKTISKKKDTPVPGPSGKRAEAQRKRPPRPSRSAVDKAEAALASAEDRHRAELDRLRAEEQALQQRRRDAERQQRSECERLSKEVDAARERYRAAMAEWAG